MIFYIIGTLISQKICPAFIESEEMRKARAEYRREEFQRLPDKKNRQTMCGVQNPVEALLSGELQFSNFESLITFGQLFPVK